jgi:hypothetical protein
METKICSMCKKELPLMSFSKHKSSKNGIRSYCKECAKGYKNKWDEENRDKNLAYKKQYNKEHALQNIEYSKQYRIEHLEHCREYDKQRYQSMKEEKKIYSHNKCREYYKEHRENIIKKVKQYTILNREKTKVYKKKNKLLRKEISSNLPCTFTSSQWEECLAYFDNKCAYCDTETNMTQDHVIPVTKGGSYTADNIIPTCCSCNSSKNGSDMETWYKERNYFTQKRLDKINKYITSKR